MPRRKNLLFVITLLLASFSLPATAATDTIPSPGEPDRPQVIKERTVAGSAYQNSLNERSLADRQRLEQIKRKTAFGPGFFRSQAID